MASRQAQVDFIVEQMAGAGAVSARKMFGEYGVFCEGRMVALVCDDTLFLKPTPGVRARIGAVEERPPYPGAKPCLVVPTERWDEAEWLADLVRTAAAELPEPARKRTRAKR